MILIPKTALTSFMLLKADEAVVTVSEKVMATVGTLYTLAKDLGMTSFSTSDQT